MCDDDQKVITFDFCFSNLPVESIEEGEDCFAVFFNF